MEEIRYNDLYTTSACRDLLKLNKNIELKNLLSDDRIRKYTIKISNDLNYNFAAKRVDGEILDLLQKLADEQQVVEKYKCLLKGSIMNPGENRKVLHHLTRREPGNKGSLEIDDLENFYRSEQERIYSFADELHSGKIKGSTGKTFESVVQIGIGGSDLGPRALYMALENLVANDKQKMTAHFISNIDPDDSNFVFSRIDPESTLFILVSKSGTTQETLTNMKLIVKKLKSRGINPSKHILTVTARNSPISKPDDYLKTFYIDDFIGGRYSVTSAVGGVVLSLAFGRDFFSELLLGAGKTDQRALEIDILKNASLMDALIGVYERNFLGLPSTAILPYSRALSRFPAHLQQVDMESNGKSVNRYGKPLTYSTGPLIFGEPGTNGQHSFFQFLHQGSDIIPLQFIGFKEPQSEFDEIIEGSTNQTKLNANLAAQITAFAVGKENENKTKNFPGNRPSSLIHGKKLTPEALGALLAHYENKVMFQGFIWNINSFDQEGVQLGKILAKSVLSGQSKDQTLNAFAEILEIRNKQ